MRKRPQALHSTEPASSRRQSGVVLVPQFRHTGWRLLAMDALMSRFGSLIRIRIRSRSAGEERD